MPDTYLSAQREQESKHNGYVVVTIWENARSWSASLAFEHYERLEDAAAHYRHPGPQFRGHAILLAKDGLPTGESLPADVIMSVLGGKRHLYGLREYEPNSPENMHYREERHREGRPPGAPRGVPGVTFDDKIPVTP